MVTLRLEFDGLLESAPDILLSLIQVRTACRLPASAFHLLTVLDSAAYDDVV
jgi:hypothetical protein